MKYRFTRHATDRLREFRLPYKKAIELIDMGIEIPPEKHRYDKEVKTIQGGTFNFIINKNKNIVITVYNKMLDIPASYYEKLNKLEPIIIKKQKLTIQEKNQKKFHDALMRRYSKKQLFEYLKQ